MEIKGIKGTVLGPWCWWAAKFDKIFEGIEWDLGYPPVPTVLEDSCESWAIGPNLKHHRYKIYHGLMQQLQHLSCVSMPFLSKAAPGFLSMAETLADLTDNHSMWVNIGCIHQCVLHRPKNQFTKRFMSNQLKQVTMFHMSRQLNSHGMLQIGTWVDRYFYIRYILLRIIWIIRSRPFCKVERWHPDSDENWNKRTQIPRFSILGSMFNVPAEYLCPQVTTMRVTCQHKLLLTVVWCAFNIPLRANNIQPHN